VGAVRRKRVVVAIEDDDGPGSDHGIHGGNLLGGRDCPGGGRQRREWSQ
jgi:hypothetical protein